MPKIALRSGRQVEIRPIRPDDAERLNAAYDALSEQSKYRRFLAAKPRLSESDTRYLVQVDGCNHVALVATAVEDPNRIIGVARFVRLPEDPRTAEFAVVVGDPYQREGLGTALLERLADEAIGRGIRQFIATTLADNVAVHRLVARLAGRLARARHLGPVDELEIELAA
jgi:RimJ/RimL family protein N-acetyltransferase